MVNQICIAGVDEAGRGPLADPVVAAAVILHPRRPIRGLADSKLLTEKKRETLYRMIVERCHAWAVGHANVTEIDTFNIFQATLLALRRAVEALPVKPQHVLVDGTHCPPLFCSAEAIIRGDQTIPVISAASIIAKVTRDREMRIYDAHYPAYGFAQHKGYSTPQHVAALQQYGPTPLHRRSFAPVKMANLK